MTCEELRPDYLLYAMGTMGEPESSELRAHLARGCPSCTEGLRQAHALAYSMGAALPGPDPSARLRGRVLAIAGAAPAPADRAAPRAPFWSWPIAPWQAWALAAACAALALAPGVFWYRERSAWHSQQAAAAALLDRDERAAAALRAQIAGLANRPSARAVPIFSLELERGAGNAPARRLSIPRDAAAVVLALPTDLVRQASAAEIRAASGQAIWSVSPLPAGDADSTGLSVDAQVLPNGRYTLILLAGQRTLAQLPLEVVR